MAQEIQKVQKNREYQRDLKNKEDEFFQKYENEEIGLLFKNKQLFEKLFININKNLSLVRNWDDILIL